MKEPYLNMVKIICAKLTANITLKGEKLKIKISDNIHHHYNITCFGGCREWSKSEKWVRIEILVYMGSVYTALEYLKDKFINSLGEGYILNKWQHRLSIWKKIESSFNFCKKQNIIPDTVKTWIWEQYKF